THLRVFKAASHVSPDTEPLPNPFTGETGFLEALVNAAAKKDEASRFEYATLVREMSHKAARGILNPTGEPVEPAELTMRRVRGYGAIDAQDARAALEAIVEALACLNERHDNRIETALWKAEAVIENAL